jgi:hypothetical protein
LTTETRWIQNLTHTINGLLGYKLLTSNSSTYVYASGSDSPNLTAYWGIRVWKRTAAGVETEVTSGTPVAQVSRVWSLISAEGFQSATWACPLTTLAATDAIVVRCYIRFGGNAWQLLLTSTTEQIGATGLVAVTWTVTYYTQAQGSGDGSEEAPYGSGGFLYWGHGSYYTRIENFQWSTITEHKIYVQWVHLVKMICLFVIGPFSSITKGLPCHFRR